MTKKGNNTKRGSVLIAGGGIGGMQAALDLAVQEVGAAAEAVKNAAAQLEKARTDLEVFQIQSERVILKIRPDRQIVH